MKKRARSLLLVAMLMMAISWSAEANALGSSLHLNTTPNITAPVTVKPIIKDLLPPVYKPPTEFAGTIDPDYSVKLTWKNNSTDVNGYYLDRMDENKEMDRTEIWGYNSEDRDIHSHGLGSNDFKYRLTPYKKDANGYKQTLEASEVINVYFPGGVPPQDVVNFRGTGISSNAVKLEWEYPLDNASEFWLRCTRNGAYVDLDDVSGNVRTYTFEGMEAGVEYEFKIQTNNYHSTATKPLVIKVSTPRLGSAVEPEQPTQPEKTNPDAVPGDQMLGTPIASPIASPIAQPVMTTPPVALPIVPEPVIVSDKSVTDIRFLIGEKNYHVGNTPLTMDVKPEIVNGRTYLPLRYVVEPIGGTVQWVAAEQKITLVKADKTINLWIGKNSATVNGIVTPIDSQNADASPYVVQPGRTMVPLRFILENLGFEVVWDEKTQEIKISNGSKS